MAKDSARDAELASKLQDPFLRRSVKTALHLRRYLPFYVFGTIWIITLTAFPSIRNAGDSDDGTLGVAGGIAAPGENAAVDGLGGASQVATPGGDTAAAGTQAAAAAGGAARGAARTAVAGAAGAAGQAAAGAAATAEQAAAAIQRHTGKTRLGLECKDGVRQVPLSTYAAPCQNVYSGPNGGATYRGVTDKEIVIVRRKFPESPNSRAVAEVRSAAGYASDDVVEQVRTTLLEYFNKSYELYGRKVKYVLYESKNGNSTEEAQSKGKQGACLDADEIVKEIKAFAVMSGSHPFGECAAERKMPVFEAASYFPESFFRKYHPYLWNTVMECERISYQLGEYIGERLLDKPAKWAGDAVMQKQTRYFGTYVPDNDGYQRCVSIIRNTMKTKYGVKDPGPQYNYQLDISRFPDQAAAASVQFSSAGVTTVVLACDFVSAVVLTEAAENQGWHPEWLLIGVGGTDADNSARLYNQNQVNGHMFGMSQLGQTTKLIGKDSEPGRVYRNATGKEIPEGTSGDYFGLVHMFNMLQAAGPVLTPENLGKGAMTLPPGGAPEFPAGYWSLLDGPDGTPGAGDHTEVEDSREVFWVSEPGTPTAGDAKARDNYYNGPDGKNGTLKETYNGKRFRNGEWPKEDPPIYPPRQ